MLGMHCMQVQQSGKRCVCVPAEHACGRPGAEPDARGHCYSARRGLQPPDRPPGGGPLPPPRPEAHRHRLSSGQLIPPRFGIYLYYYYTLFLPGARWSADKLQKRLPKSCPLMDSPDPSKTQSTVGTGISSPLKIPWTLKAPS